MLEQPDCLRGVEVGGAEGVGGGRGRVGGGGDNSDEPGNKNPSEATTIIF